MADYPKPRTTEKPVEMYNGGTTIVRTVREIIEEFGLRYDSRFRSWGKVVSGVDLDQKGGYALQGEFFNGATVIPDGAWVVVASETGTRNYHSYEYRLLQNQKGKLVRVLNDPESIKNELAPQVYANALNSKLYAYAARIWYNSQRPAP
jgi:hypothetical protein